MSQKQYIDGNSNFTEWMKLIDAFVDWRRYELSKYKKISLAMHGEWSDIKQDLYVAAWQSKDKFDKSRPLGPWLKTMVIHKIGNVIAKRFRDFKAAVYTEVMSDKFEEHDFDEGVVLNLFRRGLTEAEGETVDLILRGNSMKQVSRKSKRSLARVYQLRNRVERKYKQFKLVTV